MGKLTADEILSTEYSTKFDEIRKNMMVMSYYKYGKMSDNHSTENLMDAVANLRKRLEKYEQTGNTEFLADVANFAMIEFMHPQHKKAFYKSTESGACENVGFGINEVIEFDIRNN